MGIENKITVRNNKKKILFVCTQNVFRSMSAHYLTEKHLLKKSIKHFEIDSCGTKAYPWEVPYEFTVELFQKKGIDVTRHKNKQITAKLVKESEIIICMTNEHKKFIIENFKIEPFLFNEIAIGKLTDLNDDDEIDFDCTLHEFIEKTIVYIEKHIPKLVQNLDKY